MQITCVKASQGFDWNQGKHANSHIISSLSSIAKFAWNLIANGFRTEIFLPSYIDHDSEDLERRQQPVRDIILTDEEAAALLPQ